MLVIYARLDMKPEHPSDGEMVRRLKSFQRKMHRQEFERMLNAQRDESALGIRFADGSSKWDLLKRRAVSFFKDFSYYIDFCMARFLIWRMMLHERKKAKSEDMEN